jgi:N12 class adenine-specific DNA methylase
MEALLSRPREEFLPELKGLVYRNPQTEQWETDDQYLSGDVRTKLQNARAAAATDPTYQENVTALEAVQPADLTATDIDARLGAVWIPPGDVEAFAKALLGNEGINVSHAAAVGTWFIKGDYGARATIANSTEWGTGRYSALELIQDALNLKTPTVYDTDPRTKSSVINAQETEAARDRLEMFAVPNHMLAQFSSELLTLYPTANILVAGKDDFEASRRARLFSRIATGNWDAVMVTHSSFEKIRVSAETRRGFISEQIREIEKAIREQRADRGTRLVKELERVRKRLEAKLETLSADDKRDNTLTFEELGIDRLFID